jgi:hypothetical protein
MDCISCDGKINEQQLNELTFEYDIFCDNEKGAATIAVCDHCDVESANPNSMIAIEMIACAKIFRAKNPDAVLTPAKKKKKPEEPKPEQE